MRKYEERAHACKLELRYAGALAADHGVAFPDLLNTEADEGQLQHTKLCLLSSKTNRTVLKWFEAHVQRYIVANVTIVFDNSHNKTILVIVKFFSALECLSSGGRKVSLYN